MWRIHVGRAGRCRPTTRQAQRAGGSCLSGDESQCKARETTLALLAQTSGDANYAEQWTRRLALNNQKCQQVFKTAALETDGIS